MVDLVRDSGLDPFFFTIMKDGAGVDLLIDGATPANSLVDGDLVVYSWKPLPAPQGTITVRTVDVSVELVKVNPTGAPGEMLWFPTAADTRCNCFSLVIRDESGDDAFDENRLRGYTHGRYNKDDPDDTSRFHGIV